MVGDLTWRLTTDGHNEKAQCQSHYASLQENTHISTSAGVPRFFDSTDSPFREISLLGSFSLLLLLLLFLPTITS